MSQKDVSCNTFPISRVLRPGVQEGDLTTRAIGSGVPCGATKKAEVGKIQKQQKTTNTYKI
jgi:hypothetical protein